MLLLLHVLLLLLLLLLVFTSVYSAKFHAVSMAPVSRLLQNNGNVFSGVRFAVQLVDLIHSAARIDRRPVIEPVESIENCRRSADVTRSHSLQL